ncbi:Alpha/Beta hydrolase protein [Irpex rosettiformis]|uniref:Alpha/Beta hydrolase protein n=1 Tax=Irpex rosettiformis TaxID=378272 RepID=A0ACB8U2N7_9APHY|nr:Alpha/Beta hydrolase protein [Irpex rosettiformis]
MNVFAPDYRGFGDSEGIPSEPGLEIDAYASWKWLVDNGAKPEDIVVVGHSLGTGVTASLAKRLAADGVKPRGLVLLAPFTSPRDLIETYAILGVPILQPVQAFSAGRKFLQDWLSVEFDTLSVIQEFNAPTLIAHSHDDDDIPYEHSRTLIDKLLDPLLPVLASATDSSLSPEDFAAFTKAQGDRRDAKNALVRKTDIPNFGTVEEFNGQNAPKVVYVECFWGKHIDVGMQEGVQDEIGKLFDLL